MRKHYSILEIQETVLPGISCFKKNTSEKIYTSIKYVAKKVPLDKLDLSDELKNKISLEEYREK